MENQLITAITTIALAIVGVASLSALVSKNAATSQVIDASGRAFSGGLATALSPVTGSGAGANIYNGAAAAGGGRFTFGTGLSY